MSFSHFGGYYEKAIHPHIFAISRCVVFGNKEAEILVRSSEKNLTCSVIHPFLSSHFEYWNGKRATRLGFGSRQKRTGSHCHCHDLGGGLKTAALSGRSSLLL